MKPLTAAILPPHTAGHSWRERRGKKKKPNKESNLFEVTRLKTIPRLPKKKKMQSNPDYTDTIQDSITMHSMQSGSQHIIHQNIKYAIQENLEMVHIVI